MPPASTTKKRSSRRPAQTSRRTRVGRRPKKRKAAAAAAAADLSPEERLLQTLGFDLARSGTKLDVARVRSMSNLSQAEFARLGGYSTRAVAGWEAGKPIAQPARRRIAELARLLQALAELMPAGTLGPWLRESNEAFEGQTPMHVVERGEIDRLWQMIHQIDANVPN